MSNTPIFEDSELLQLLRTIETNGHNYNEEELNQCIVKLEPTTLPLVYYHYGINSFNNYLSLYNLDEENAFSGDNLDLRPNYIKLNFHDGSINIKKKFLNKYFSYFQYEFELNDNINTFTIEDFSFYHFVEILKYFYCKSIYINLENAIDLYRIADFFVIDVKFTKHLVSYINRFFLKLGKTIGFYRYYYIFEQECLKTIIPKYQATNTEELYEISRLYILYISKYQDMANESVKELVKNKFNNFKRKVDGYKKMEHHLEEAKVKGKSDNKTMSDILIVNNEMFLYNYDSIQPNVSHLKIIPDITKIFQRFEYPIKQNTKHIFIPYKKSFIILRNGFLENNNVDDEIFYESYQYEEDAKEEDKLNIYKEQQLGFNIGSRNFEDYFIFENEDFIYFLLIDERIEDEYVFFRINISDGTREVLPNLNKLVIPYKVCCYKSTLYFLIKSECKQTRLSHIKRKNNNLMIRNSYAFDLVKHQWINYKQPYIFSTENEVDFEIINDKLYLFKTKITEDEESTKDDVIMEYNPSENNVWINFNIME
uniref:BTB domain-containing protein n=1 Tax=Parastrongyloides trichosuri TaxID=131310 RepID=A0A0N4ZUB8_PARTI